MIAAEAAKMKTIPTEKAEVEKTGDGDVEDAMDSHEQGEEEMPLQVDAVMHESGDDSKDVS